MRAGVRAYQNEFDPYAAQWLRNLSGRGLIPESYVDDRSIKEVMPEDLPSTHPDKVWERKQRLTASTGIYRGNDCGLGSKVHFAGRPTPMAGTPAQNGNNEAGNTDSGRKTQSLFPARTERGAGYRLNPAFSLWLMGFPVDEWLSCAPQGMRSSRKKLRSSSPPLCKQSVNHSRAMREGGRR